MYGGRSVDIHGPLSGGADRELRSSPEQTPSSLRSDPPEAPVPPGGVKGGVVRKIPQPLLVDRMVRRMVYVVVASIVGA